jgi:hypothetical protein
VESVEKEFHDNDSSALLMVNPKDGKKGLWTDGRRKVIKDGVDIITADMAMEEDADPDDDPINDIPFEEICEERRDFDVDDTTAFDVEMADIMCVHGCSWLKETTKTGDDENKKAVRAALFAKRR